MHLAACLIIALLKETERKRRNIMLQQEICPDCENLIPVDRMDEDIVICPCGFTKSKAQMKFDKRNNKITSYTIILVALFILGAFIHTAKWGTDSIKVAPLQISELVDGLSPKQTIELADFSFDHKYFEKSEKLYQQFLDQNPDHERVLEINEKLGMLLFRQKKFAQAVEPLENYFLSNGENPQTLFSYGKSLTETQDLGDAEEVFLRLIKTKPEVYQVTVVQALLDLYVAQNKLTEAKQFISKLIKPGYVVPTHLQEQKELINELISKKS